MTCTDSLIELISLSTRLRQSFDWKAIENKLGSSLPDDYRTLVEVTPQGRFRGFVDLIRPGDIGHPDTDFLGYYAHRLDDMRSWREAEPSRFPYPIFPESSGLLPWAVTPNHDLVFWLTEGRDPNSWPVVVADNQFATFAPVASSACEFLTMVATGRFDASPYGFDLTGKPPWRERVMPKSVAPIRPVEQYWIDRQLVPGCPESKLRELSTSLISSESRPEPVGWSDVEDQFGFALPSDYKLFIDRYGPGDFGDIRVCSPGAAPGDYHLFNLLDRIQRRPAINSRPRKDPPVFPDEAGIVAWGEASDGTICAWAPSARDRPDQWGVVTSGPELRAYQYHSTKSFSGLLHAYADLDRPDPLGFRDIDRPSPVVFIPV